MNKQPCTNKCLISNRIPSQTKSGKVFQSINNMFFMTLLTATMLTSIVLADNTISALSIIFIQLARNSPIDFTIFILVTVSCFGFEAELLNISAQWVSSDKDWLCVHILNRYVVPFVIMDYYKSMLLEIFWIALHLM